ncbi:MAG: aminotransferase class V-fold PLP-dependent enzyme [Dehalococcoidia bacterium]
MTSDDPLLRWRDEFPILGRCTYLISNSLGAMPRAAYHALRQYADEWASEGVTAWHHWLPEVGRFGDEIGRLFGAPPGSVILHQNVSILQAILVSALDFPPERPEVLLCQYDFPTIHYFWLEQARRGAQPVVVRGGDPVHPPVEQFIDRISPRTRVVALSHVFYGSSYLIPLEPLVRRAHECGALVFLDAFHSVGVIPFDAQEIDVDVLFGGCLKWLCGGPGAAFVYVRPSLIHQLRPADTGWLSHRDPFSFADGPIDLADDAYRFLGGTPSIPALYAAREGVRIIGQVGAEAIRQKSVRQTSLLSALALEAGLTVNTPRDPERRGGTVAVDCPQAAAIADALIERGFLIDYRPGFGIRIAPHFYNSDAECEAVISEIASLRDKGG